MDLPTTTSRVEVRWSQPGEEVVEFPLPDQVPQDAKWNLHRPHADFTVIAQDLAEVPAGDSDFDSPASPAMLTFALADSASSTNPTPSITIRRKPSVQSGLLSIALITSAVTLALIVFALLFAPTARISVGLTVAGALFVAAGSPIVGAIALAAGPTSWLVAPRTA